MTQPVAIVLCAGLIFSLSGCASAPPTYDLNAVSYIGKTHRQHNVSLAVLDPIAGPALASDDIIIKTGPDALSTLANAQWVEPLPSLIRFRLVETIANANIVKAVGPAGAVADFVLATTLRQFAVNVTRGEAEVEILATIGSDRTGRAVSTKIFRSKFPAPATANGAAVRALDAALSDAMRQITDWVATKL